MKDYSNYHDADVNSKIERDGLLLLEQSLNGYAGQNVLINDSINTKVLMMQKYDSNGSTKKVIGRVEDIEIGNIIKCENENWLVITKPETNRIYHKADIQICNETFLLSGKDERIQNGVNEFGQPKWTIIKGETTPLPCIAQATILSDDTNEAINMLEGQMLITIPFTEHDDITEGKDFTMYNAKYKIMGIDYTKSINKVGLLIIKGKRV